MRLFEYFNFIDKVLSHQNPDIIEPFISEFLEDYFLCVSKFESFGVIPDITKKLLEQLEVISSFEFVSHYKEILESEIRRIESQHKKLTAILAGEDYNKDNLPNRKAYFPLIAENSPGGLYGIIESVTIHIRKAEEADKFIIVPSEKEVAKRILNQCITSWQLALNLARTYIHKPYKYHEVIINFDKKEGFYEGTSLGIALALSFLEQLLKFYNPTYVIRIKGHTAFTGGISVDGKALPCSKEVIEQKIKSIFFSEITSFVLPKKDEVSATEQLAALQKDYPSRRLKLITIEDMDDILNRRDLVEIKKQKLIVRIGKFVKKNWVSAVVTVLLAVFFGYLFVMDWDNNPALVEINGLSLYVKNAKGKILWTDKLDEYSPSLFGTRWLDNYIKIVDVDLDGKNEVLACNQIFIEKEFEAGIGDILCLNSRREVIWKYSFSDTVYSEGETLSPPFNIEIIDTVTLNNKNQIILFANNANSFASAIFKLDLKTGKKVDETHWASGFTYESVLKDVNKDGNLDIILLGHDNGFGEHVLWAISLNKLFGYRPSTYYKSIKYQPEAELFKYIRLPKTDYEKFIKPKDFTMNQGSILMFEGYITVTSFVRGMSAIYDFSTAIIYKFTDNLNEVDIFIGDRFRELRDTLIVHGKLNPPFTETREYKKIIKDNLLYYKNGKWVKREELE